MTDEETALRAELAAAAAAEDALRSLRDAFAILEAEYVKAWKTTPVRDADARERLWQAVQIVAKVEAHLRAVASGRRLAERQLAEIARFGKRERVLGVF
jgi:hypothetical protein